MRLHLIDGTFELYRAHFSPKPDRPHKATVGLVASLLTLLADPDEKATHLAVAFDNPIRSFRNDMFAGYKSDEGVPPELHAQFDAAEEATRAAGVTVWSMSRYEADDAIATAARRHAPPAGETPAAGACTQVRILSPDKDFGQCLADRRVVQVDRIRRKEIDEAAMRAVRGVGPASIPDLLALTGDTADGIPGLTGFGAKTAAALLARFEHVEAIPDDPAAWPAGVRGAPRLAGTLRGAREDLALYKELATLVTDVPLDETLEDLRWRGTSPDFGAWTDRMGARDLAARARALSSR